MNDKAKMIKIYISNTDLYEDEPLYHFLARMAKEFNMAGATIYKGMQFFNDIAFTLGIYRQGSYHC